MSEWINASALSVDASPATVAFFLALNAHCLFNQPFLTPTIIIISGICVQTKGFAPCTCRYGVLAKADRYAIGNTKHFKFKCRFSAHERELKHTD